LISIRRTLLAWLLLALTLVAIAADAVTYFRARAEINALYDRQLEQIARLWQAREHSTPVLSPAQARGASSWVGVVVQVWGGDGLLRYSSSPGAALPRHPESGLATVSWGDEPWRVLVVTRGSETIQVAEPLASRMSAVHEMALSILKPLTLAFIPALALLIWIAVGRSLRPLDDIARALGQRRPSALEPLTEGRVPAEVKPLISALNDLFLRLSRAMEGQRRFIADAAHELRTPLSAVQLQIQVVERATTAEERLAALARLRNGIQRASHLVQQLLTMARIEPDATEVPFQKVDMEELVRNVLGEYAPLAQKRNIDLGLARAEPAAVLGDAESLRAMLGNLMDNAVRHSPEGSQMDASVHSSDGNAVLEIVDNGPGIPGDERHRIFDRFYRGAATGVPGSGLGLAIVKRVAERHRAEITLTDGPNGRGLRVTVRFPAATR
jgi:two-component system OmpR family sensor kinase